MNDFDAMKALLIQMGYTEQVEDKIGHHALHDKTFYVGSADQTGTLEYQTSICLGSGIGYGGFCCEFFFDVNGKAITHGCWE